MGFHILASTLHIVVVVSGLKGVKQGLCLCMCNIMIVVTAVDCIVVYA